VVDLVGPAIAISVVGEPFGSKPFSQKLLVLLAPSFAFVGDRTASPPTPVAPSVPPSVDDETSTERVEVDFLAAAVGTCGSVLAPTNPILVPALLVPLVDGTAVSFSPPPPSRLGSAKSSVDGIGAGLGFISPYGESSCGAVCTVLVSRPVDARIIMGCVGIWRIYLAILQSANLLQIAAELSTHSTLHPPPRAFFFSGIELPFLWMDTPRPLWLTTELL